MKFRGYEGQVLNTEITAQKQLRLTVGAEGTEGVSILVHPENAVSLKNWLVANLPETTVSAEAQGDLNVDKAPTVDGQVDETQEEVNPAILNNGDQAANVGADAATV